MAVLCTAVCNCSEVGFRVAVMQMSLGAIFLAFSDSSYCAGTSFLTETYFY